MHRIKSLLLLLIIPINYALATENNNIKISDAWISESPPTVFVLAAYAKIHNSSNQTQTLTSISSPSFEKIELHLSKVINDVAKMEKQNSFSIPENSSLELTPGAYHLMLFNPESPLEIGDTVPLTFNFSDNTSYTTQAVVKKRNTNDHEHNHDHHNHHH